MPDDEPELVASVPTPEERTVRVVPRREDVMCALKLGRVLLEACQGDLLLAPQGTLCVANSAAACASDCVSGDGHLRLFNSSVCCLDNLL